MKDTQPPKRAKRTRLWIALAVLALIVIVTVLACTLSLLLNNSSSSGTNSSGHSDSEKPYWPGWSGIKHLTVFGDSMTNVDFNIDGEQPSRANPIGNPEFPGRTSSIGPNWAGFLTGTYNASFIRTIDLGSGGATVDSDILDGDFPTTRSFADQVLSDWIPNYVKTKPSQFNWAANDTLFAIFFGLNDVRGAYFDDWISKGKSLNEDVARYVALLGDLYRSGSRNFLVLKLPPFQRAPMVANNTEGQREVKSLIDGFNTNLTKALSEFSNANSDAAVFLFDTHKLWNQIFDNPCSFKETCPLQDTTTYCPAYQNERENPYLDDPECAYPLDKYFWINRIHCIFRVHDAMADGIASYLTDMS